MQISKYANVVKCRMSFSVYIKIQIRLTTHQVNRYYFAKQCQKLFAITSYLFCSQDLSLSQNDLHNQENRGFFVDKGHKV